ncbi:hypothetical protein Lser_V15G22791 [Lactuca serriola]
MSEEEAKENHDVVAGTILVDSNIARILFDSGASYSFVSHSFCLKLIGPLATLSRSYSIEIADGTHVSVGLMYPDCSLEINGRNFSIDLLPMRIKGFDVIVGMDWMRANDAKILCGKQMVSIKTTKGKKFGNRDNKFPCVISSIKSQKCLSKGCESLLAYVINGKEEKKKIEEVKVVSEFPEAFPEDLYGLPPIRQVEFGIDIVSGVNHVSRAPYRLASTKMWELMS